MTNFVESGRFLNGNIDEALFPTGFGWNHTGQFAGGGSNFLRASIALNFLAVYQDPIAVVFPHDISVSSDRQ
jgi:hypothetical protein